MDKSSDPSAPDPGSAAVDVDGAAVPTPKRAPIDRRTFLGLVGGASAVAVTGAVWASRAQPDRLFATPRPSNTSPSLPASPRATDPPVGDNVGDPDPATAEPVAEAAPFGAPMDRTLVVVQMMGGNDGLNTVIPVADGRYFDARPTLGITPADALELPGVSGYGLHPELAPLVPLWTAGSLAAVQSVGLPQQSRSHFVATDTWWSGRPGQPFKSGWLGRFLDQTGGTSSNPMRALSLGAAAPGLTGKTSHATVVRSVHDFDLLPPQGDREAVSWFEAAAAHPAGGLLGEAQHAVPSAARAVRVLQDLKPDSVQRRSGTAALFDTAASVIQGQVGAQVIVIQIRGFDTHADQAAPHGQQLHAVSSGISSLLATLAATGADQRTLVMTFSEFGRRVAENGSLGTDHGDGGLAFLAGPAVQGALVGEPDLGDLVNGDLRSSIDMRSIYAAGLTWLGGDVEQVLGQSWDTYGLLDARV